MAHVEETFEQWVRGGKVNDVPKTVISCSSINKARLVAAKCEALELPTG